LLNLPSGGGEQKSHVLCGEKTIFTWKEVPSPEKTVSERTYLKWKKNRDAVSHLKEGGEV